MKAVKVIVSGNYLGHDKEIFDFIGLEGIVPYNEEDIVMSAVRMRFVTMWILKDPETYKDRPVSKRLTHFDDYEIVEHKFSFVGKDIKQMTFEELQDLAVYKDLKAIPLYKKTGLRQAQTIAYAEYSKQILGKEIKYRDSDFNFVKLPPIIVAGEARKDGTKKTTNEEFIQRAQNSNNLDEDNTPKMSRADLEAIAASQGVNYHPNISDENLYKKLYGNA